MPTFEAESHGTCPSFVFNIPQKVNYDDDDETTSDSESSSGTPDSPLQRRGKWARSAMQALSARAAEGHVTATKIRGRKFSHWLRAFMNEQIAQGRLRPSKATPTSRLIGLLAAKAEANPTEALTVDEFNAFTSVLQNPTPEIEFEIEFAWSLFDTGSEGAITAENFERLRAVLASQHIACDEYANEAAQRAVAAAIEEEDNGITAERYVEWINECNKHRKKKSRSDWTPYGKRNRVQDQVKRSEDVSDMRLFTQPFWDSNVNSMGRDLEPSHCSERKLPGKEGRIFPITDKKPGTPRNPEKALEGPTSKKLPALKNASSLDHETQQEIWTERSKRLRPYLRVKASYMKADGSKVSGLGTLMSGWGSPNKTVDLLHAKRPEGACPPPPREKPPPWEIYAHRHEDTDRFVFVLFHDGVEKLVPRAWVEAIDQYGS